MPDFFKWFEPPNYTGLDHRSIQAIEENRTYRRALTFLPTAFIAFVYIFLSTAFGCDIRKQELQTEALTACYKSGNANCEMLFKTTVQPQPQQQNQQAR